MIHDAWKAIPTSREVYAVIRARHADELNVYGSSTAMEGNELHPRQGYMYTSWGFKGADFPLMEAETTWDLNPENLTDQPNRVDKFWLCVPKKGVEE
jgi:hypothetical protein